MKPRRLTGYPSHRYTPMQCHVWTGAINSTGYPVIWANDKPTSAHRYLWALVHQEPIPDGMHVHHMCHNRLCVNPEHLQLVTPQTHAALHEARRSAPEPRERTRRGRTLSKADRGWIATLLSLGWDTKAIARITGHTEERILKAETPESC